MALALVMLPASLVRRAASYSCPLAKLRVFYAQRFDRFDKLRLLALQVCYDLVRANQDDPRRCAVVVLDVGNLRAQLLVAVL